MRALLARCFGAGSDCAPATSHKAKASYSVGLSAPSATCGACLPDAPLQPRPSRDEDESPAERNIPYTPKDVLQRLSKSHFYVELRQPSTQPESRTNVEYTTADELVKDVQDLKWLGQGAQGVVYEGIWQGATVAVKFSIVDDLDTTAYELLFSKLLSHPNVVQTFLAKVAVLDEKTIHASHDCSVHLLHTNSHTCGGGAASAAAGPRTPAQAHPLQHQPSSQLQQHQHSHLLSRGPSHNGASPAAAAAASALYRPSDGGGCGGVPSGMLTTGQSICAGSGGGGGPYGGAACSRQESCDLGALGGGGGASGFTRLDSFRSDDGFGDPLGRKSTFTDVRDVLASLGAKPGHFIAQMVMEHCDHGSLHAAIQRGIFKPTSKWGPKLALRALIRTVREVSQGMFHLHSNNVLHGDLKPANVLLINSRKDRRGYVAKVSDFGLAQFCSKDHISNAPWGTLVYMAPERLLHGHLCAASDVYSFGVMLWEMYHGQRPYEGMHAAQIVMACAQGAGQAHLHWAPDACEELVRISRHCMAAAPHERPSFEALMRRLALLEARVRQEGAARISIEQTTRQSSRLSAEIPSQGPSLPPSRAPSGPLHQLPAPGAALQHTHAAPHAAPAYGRQTLHRAATGPIPSARASLESAHGGAGGRRCSQEQARSRLSAESCRHPTAAPAAGSPPPPPPQQQQQQSPVQPSYQYPAQHRPRRVAPRGPSLLGIASVPEDAAMPAAAAAAPDGAIAAMLARCTSAAAGAADSESGRRSGGSGAAAIAAALAAQPGMASAVVAELLVRLGQQQGAQTGRRSVDTTAPASAAAATVAATAQLQREASLPLPQSPQPSQQPRGGADMQTARSSPAAALLLYAAAAATTADGAAAGEPVEQQTSLARAHSGLGGGVGSPASPGGGASPLPSPSAGLPYGYDDAERASQSAPLCDTPASTWATVAAAAAAAGGGSAPGTRGSGALGASAPLPGAVAQNPTPYQLQRQMPGMGAGVGSGSLPSRGRCSSSRPRECPTITEEPN